MSGLLMGAFKKFKFTSILICLLEREIDIIPGVAVSSLFNQIFFSSSTIYALGEYFYFPILRALLSHSNEPAQVDYSIESSFQSVSSNNARNKTPQ